MNLVQWKKIERQHVQSNEQKIIALLLQGCSNEEIGRELNMAARTVKSYFNRMFVRYGIRSGIKRVKLAAKLYREQLDNESYRA